MLCLFVISVGCGRNDGSSVSDSSSDPSVAGIPLRIEQSQGNVPITPLDKEAAKIALDDWKVTKLGQSFYVQTIAVEERFRGWPTTIHELGNVHVGQAPTEVTEADKLNGVEYHAVISLRADAERTYCPEKGNDLGGRYQVMPRDTTWTKWQDVKLFAPLFSVRFDKANGKWSEPGDAYRCDFKQVEASDLPK
jgi:hypothetical protein